MDTSYVNQKIKYKLAKLLSKTIYWANSTVINEKHLWLKNQLKHCGKGVHFHGNIKIIRPENVVLEDNVIIGENSYLDGRGGINIGQNTHISRNFVIHSSSHDYHSSRLPYDDTYVFKPIIIGRNVWICTNVILIPGITIEDGAIIGAGTTVTKSIPKLAIVGNQPTRIIKFRDCEHYQNLDSQKSYGGISGKELNKKSSN
ncbi:Transferase hexapeptide repeat containing protein [Hyella patelloides LEGE 07179]|uniref:Transferase hexapeptide repeat containing protein n=1 Tax=Hyella patelloides LEGE 07179 TaxID=945734 RepID=A0A563W5C2_9CYAN|nr:acyltransferase [Hyella patelloides]VEP18901.1 Transferase hexapeptide repeat containing protein [Hyella patelloides LEGE 07179]